VEFLPGHTSSISSAKAHRAVLPAVGHASILTISWMYIRMMGADGDRSDEVRHPQANYIPSGSKNNFRRSTAQRPRRARMHLDLRTSRSVTAEDWQSRL